MRFTSTRLAAALVAGAAVAIIAAPPASASGADAVVADLQNQGYLVQINWVNGFNTKPLDRCTVTNINNPSSDPPKPGDNVYVDVRCPNHDEYGDDGDFGIGIGFGFG